MTASSRKRPRPAGWTNRSTARITGRSGSWCGVALALLALGDVAEGQLGLNTTASFSFMSANKYPQKALHCRSSLTEPDDQVICPEFANAYCVKEVMGMDRIAKLNCGRTKYFGDRFSSFSGQCELRKCAAACEEATWNYEFEGITYERKRFCCQYDLCNAASRSRPQAAATAVLVPLVGAAAYALSLVL